MAEPSYLQIPRSWRNLAITQFNRQTGKEIYLLFLDHSGAKLETPFSLSLQYPVEFSFVLPGAPGEIKVAGRVIGKQQLTVPPGRYQLQVQFYTPRWDLDRLSDHSQPQA